MKQNIFLPYRENPYFKYDLFSGGTVTPQGACMYVLHMLYMLHCCMYRTSSSVYLNLDRPDPHGE